MSSFSESLGCRSGLQSLRCEPFNGFSLSARTAGSRTYQPVTSFERNGRPDQRRSSVVCSGAEPVRRRQDLLISSDLPKQAGITYREEGSCTADGSADMAPVARIDHLQLNESQTCGSCLQFLKHLGSSANVPIVQENLVSSVSPS